MQAEKVKDIIGADERGVVTSPTLLALQRLPVPAEVRANWSPVETNRYNEMVIFRAAADAFVIRTKAMVATTRMALASQ